MIFGMPAVSFFAFLSWPVVYCIGAGISYNHMAKQDAITDDSEFEQNLNPGKGAKKK